MHSFCQFQKEVPHMKARTRPSRFLAATMPDGTNVAVEITDFHDDDDVLTMLAKLAYKSDRDGNIDARIVRHVEDPNHRLAKL